MNHITSLLRGIIRTHVVLGLTFTAAIIPLLASNQSVGEAAPAPTVKNVVLVHGAFADGSSWAKVIPLLEAKGLHVTAVQNPLSSLADDVAVTKRVIAMQEGPVILVGHSWAGMVISEAGNDPKVAGLVYVAAIVPEVFVSRRAGRFQPLPPRRSNEDAVVPLSIQLCRLGIPRQQASSFTTLRSLADLFA
jgi:pimeloyl-ACP methyl ester carboxylesterase